MIDLNDIIQSAQGGQAVGNLAARFGLTPQQAQSAIDAILPAITMGMQHASAGGAAGTILSHLGSAVHQQNYADPTAVNSSAATAQAGSILGSLFGGSHNTTAVAQQAATESGVSASVIQAMLPAIISIVMGGLFHAAQGGGFGGALSSILGSVLGQGGGSLGGSPGGTAPQAPEAGGGLGGLIGSVLGGLLGGGSAPSEVAPSSEGAPISPGSAASTLDEISKMIQPGTATSDEHQARLAQILGR